ncbi:translation initiation factor IF-2-like [Leopardus geoffroyi]|uniref:translation initiation factor IF-2-like n=1 Tax=Leopardus geoffroyi TaxID=46844 RepID=UPI001E26140C|nr:translation initiation factor IF-2-like [Leopardus geoffroyi]
MTGEECGERGHKERRPVGRALGQGAHDKGAPRATPDGPTHPGIRGAAWRARPRPPLPPPPQPDRAGSAEGWAAGTGSQGRRPGPGVSARHVPGPRSPRRRERAGAAGTRGWAPGLRAAALECPAARDRPRKALAPGRRPAPAEPEEKRGAGEAASPPAPPLAGAQPGAIASPVGAPALPAVNREGRADLKRVLRNAFPPQSTHAKVWPMGLDGGAGTQSSCSAVRGV